MTSIEFAEALGVLRLSAAEAAARLGYSRRQVIRFKTGDSPVPAPLAASMRRRVAAARRARRRR